jgi:3-methyl-2-oxobutanoate hydroxymethyltransferase
MISASAFHQFKTKPMVVVTAYDAPFAARAEAAGVDAILVGDSVANTVLGFKSTRAVGMEVMLLFVGAVARGAQQTHIMADMPFGSDNSVSHALMHAHSFISAGAHSVKMEGAKLDVARALSDAGIPVVGHLGLLPQTAQSFRQVGRSVDEKAKLLEEAYALEEAGICALVLEHIPSDLGEAITKRLAIPTIGIGAGSRTNGQVLVLHDVIGLSKGPMPPFSKAFAQAGEAAETGLRRYAESVRLGEFPPA